MASDETRRRWACFRHRHRHLFEHIEENEPGFWVAAADIWQSHLRERITTRGAVVTEFPTVAEKGTQTEEVTVRDAVVTRGTQTTEVAVQEDVASQGTQTLGVWDLLDDFLSGSTARDWRELSPRDRGEDAAEKGQAAPPRPGPETPPETPKREASKGTAGPTVNGEPSSSGGPRPRGSATKSRRTGSPRRPRGCWNCWSRRHTYAECPRPRASDFCYRCGEPGTTVSNCPRCRRAWEAQGPYVPGKGHIRRGSQ